MSCDSLPDLVTEIREDLSPGIILLEILSESEEVPHILRQHINSALARQVRASARLHEVLAAHQRSLECTNAEC